ncbi:MAG: hypothetical protein K8U03_19785 [Planctomycetia bacterium]|nr:hypothetical protein [Planctomycetia bacterium]
MNALLSLLIVAVAGGAPIESASQAGSVPPVGNKPHNAADVYYCGFEEESDDDFDGWPQGWQRRRGSGYPHYLEIKISREPSFAGEYCFRMNLNGGAAAASSPPQAYDAGSEYVAEVQMKTIGLKHDKAFLALRFLDDKQKVVQSEISRHERQNDAWHKVRVGPVFCDRPEVRSVVVELHLEPGESQDLRGSALFDELRLGRLPRKNVRGKRPYNVFPVGEPVELSLTLTGIHEPTLRAKLELFDRSGRSVSSDEQTSVLDPKHPLDPRTVQWKPNVSEPGYYRGEVSLYGAEGRLQSDATSLVIVEPLAKLSAQETSGPGEFGWSVSDATHVPRVDQLHALLHETGVRRLKYPVWFDAKKPESGVALKKFIDRLNVQGIGIVGTLTPHTQAMDARFMPGEISAAQTFRLERDQWFPTIEPVLLDLAFKVRGWQLGDDRDFGFQELPGAVDRIGAVKREFDRIEQDAMVGVAWSWLNEPPQEAKPTWRYLALTAIPDLTAEETKQYMETAERPGVERWLSLSALPRDDYTIETRVRDLVDRVVAAKRAGAQSVFFLDPFHSETGLLERNGAPTEMYLPWRTLTTIIDGARPVESVRLPGGSRNQLFLRQQDAVMLLSSDTPTTEPADLEGNVRFFDLWGRTITPREEAGKSVVDVGQAPIVAVGLDRDTFVWDGACRIEQPQLQESFGVGQPSSLSIVNTFKQTVQGKITIVGPPGWTIRPSTFDISLAEGQKLRLPFQVVLPLSSESGFQLLRIEHDLASDKRRQFHLYREVQIGDNSVVLEVQTKFVGDELEVEQRLSNNSQKNVSFRCYLYAPNQRRMRAQVVELPPGIDVRTFRVPNGRALIGKTLWLRVEEQNGTRVLSNRFTVKADP